jgi:Glycosyl hydrolase family 67 C-terminus
MEQVVPMRRGALAAAVIIVLGLGLGYAVATRLDAVLAISFHDKKVPDESGYRPPAEVRFPAITPVIAIALPGGAQSQERYRQAAEALAAAIEARTGTRPAITIAPAREPGGEPGVVPAGRLITIGTATPEVSPEPATPADPQSFTVAPYELGGQAHVAIVGGSPRGEIYGMHHLADALWSGAEETDVFAARTVSPALPLRFVDPGAVGVLRDPSTWDPTDYSHNLRTFVHAIKNEPPYVDEALFEEIAVDLDAYLQRMVAYGNGGVVFGGFLELVDFDRVGDGTEVYAEHSPYRQRHAAMRRHFGRLFQIAKRLDMEVVLVTDMVALTPALEHYFQRRFGGVDVANPELWEVYRLGLEELFEAMPELDGIMIRIGEAGAIYNVSGGRTYYSALHVRTDEAVRTMLQSFLDVAAPRGKRVFFRTWSVGVGKIGDMHTNPATYERILTPLDAPNLVVSTKLIAGDYDSYLPLNPTLLTGAQARLVELQARREFEAFNAFPDYMGPQHQVALQTFRAGNPHIVGSYMWTQSGGPHHAGPMSLYPFYGFWLPIDANVYATSRLAWDPDADLGAITHAWVRQRFGTDAEVVRAITEILYRSRVAVQKGFYIGPYARRQVRALGLEPPPMMWIFKWDIVAGDSASLGSIYFTAREELDAAIAEGFEAVEVARGMRELAAGIDPGQVSDPALLAKLVESLEYEIDLFATLAWYRRLFLRYYEWIDTGSAEARAEWQEAHAGFLEQRGRHVARYGKDLDFPAFNFFAADTGLAHATRAEPMAWVARGLLAVLLILFVAGGVVARRASLASWPLGRRGLLALLRAWTTPFRGPPAEVLSASDVAVVLGAYALLGLGQLVLSSLLSPAHAVVVAVVGVAFAGAPLLLCRGQERAAWLTAATAAGFLPTALFLAMSAWHGPGRVGFLFWTSTGFRILFVTALAAAIVWGLFVLYAVARTWMQQRPAQALGALAFALGAALAGLGALPAVLGLERALTLINDEMAVLPLGLSRILGLATHLGIPLALPMYLMLAGAVLALLGLVGHVLGQPRARARGAAAVRA